MENIETGTGLPLFRVLELNEDNPTVEVDWFFLRMVISRLRILKDKKPNHIAEADIPRTLDYINKLKL